MRSVAYLGKMPLMNETDFYANLTSLPEGAWDLYYEGRRYLLCKETRLNGRVIKLYAKALGSNDVVSGNYYPTIKRGMLKPCEMSEEKVIDFVLQATRERVPSR
jgi:hypothetical protein